jgi:hypothetical protein
VRRLYEVQPTVGQEIALLRLREYALLGSSYCLSRDDFTEIQGAGFIRSHLLLVERWLYFDPGRRFY